MLALGTGCHASALTRLTDARQLAAELLVHLTTAADATDRAVMAITDEASAAFAHEAEQQSGTIQRDADELERVLKELHYSDELKLLAQFRQVFAKYQTLDREILGLSVENTNLKAQRLSFGAAQEAADAMRDALGAVEHAPAKELWHARALAADAQLAVREMQALQAPHIAASEDAQMTALESRMTAAEARASSALDALAAMPGSALQPAVRVARADLSRFLRVHDQILKLSRRNSNVRSLALALGQEHDLTALCESRIEALRDGLAARGFRGTR